VPCRYFALNCRKALSATAFTVLAVTNKFVTVAINSTIWSYHASPAGIGCLLICIASGVWYVQSRFLFGILSSPSSPSPSVLRAVSAVSALESRYAEIP